MNKDKNKFTVKVSAKELIPRDPHVVATIGKNRTFANKKRNSKSDLVGRKAKHKGDNNE